MNLLYKKSAVKMGREVGRVTEFMIMQEELMTWKKQKILYSNWNYYNNSTLKAELFFQIFNNNKSNKRTSVVPLKIELRMLEKKHRGS